MSKNSEYLIDRENKQYEVIIGLEVHAQVTSESKLFSQSSTKFGAEPNTQVSLVDAAFPGMLPVINEFCIEQAIKTGIGLKAKINKKSVFDRKNYFYADLPQGYQISQYKYPIVGEGKVILDMPNGQKEIGIERLHLEQDAGKSIHDIDPNNITESTLSHNATQIDAQIQTVTSEFQTQAIDLTVTKAGSEFFFDLPPGGAVDGYEENAFFTDPISTRLNGFVDLVDYQGFYSVVRRDGTELEIVNEVFGAFAAFIGVYAKTNAGFTLSHRDGIFESGTSGVSGLTISDFTFYFPSLTIRDFAERGSSSFALDGTKFILMPPSIQNPVAISQTAATPIPSTITVATTNYFPSEGYLFHNNGSFTGVIKYTGKTANTFTGCTLHNGDDQIASGSEIVPITID